jgi:hypothetical protein
LAKLDLQRRNGHLLQAEIPKKVVDELALQKQEEIYVRPKETRVFE